ncbi:MAG: hypothetical protein V1846_04815 [Candidatus Komeilibacteria bacterium]
MQAVFSILLARCKQHWSALIIAFGIGLVTLMPQLLLLQEAGSSYRGIDMTGTDTEEYYIIRVREAYDGHWNIASPDLSEYKAKPYAQPPLMEIIEGTLARILGVTAMQIVTIGKFVFPALLFLVLYGLFYLISRSRSLSLVAPATVILASNFILSPGGVLGILRADFSGLNTIVDYSRPINPQMSSLIFFFWLYFFYSWLKSHKNSQYFVAVLFLGLMFYTYIYSWMLAFGLIVLLLLASFFPSVTHLSLPRKKMFWLLGGALIISLPYWYNFFRSISDPIYPLLQKRYGFYSSHQFIWSNILFLDFVVLLAFYGRRSKDWLFYWFLCQFAALFFLINQQVITGLRFYPGHWHWYYIAPLTIFFVYWCLYRIISGRSLFLRYLITVIILLLVFANGVTRQYLGYEKNKALALDSQRYAAVYQWLEKNSSPDDVVLAHGQLNVDLPIYTHDNSYLSRWGEFYLVPMERFRDRLYANLYLAGANDRNIDSFVSQKNKDVYEYLFGRYQLKTGACKEGCFTQAQLDQVKADYLTWLQKVDSRQFFQQYRLDYALWDKQSDQQWNLDQYPWLQAISEINGIKIYRFQP